MVPAEQSVHAAEPVSFSDLPTAQSTQVEMSSAPEAALDLPTAQSVQVPASSADHLPAGHTEQVSDSVTALVPAEREAEEKAAVVCQSTSQTEGGSGGDKGGGAVLYKTKILLTEANSARLGFGGGGLAGSATGAGSGTYAGVKAGTAVDARSGLNSRECADRTDSAVGRASRGCSASFTCCTIRLGDAAGAVDGLANVLAGAAVFADV